MCARSPRELKDCLDPWGGFGSRDLLRAGQAWVTELTYTACFTSSPEGGGGGGIGEIKGKNAKGDKDKSYMRGNANT